MTREYPDVWRVFQNLQQASQELHLLAFQRCAARATSDMDAASKRQRVTADDQPADGGCRPSRRRTLSVEVTANINAIEGIDLSD